MIVQMKILDALIENIEIFSVYPKKIIIKNCFCGTYNGIYPMSIKCFKKISADSSKQVLSFSILFFFRKHWTFKFLQIFKLFDALFLWKTFVFYQHICLMLSFEVSNESSVHPHPFTPKTGKVKKINVEEVGNLKICCEGEGRMGG